MAILKIKSGAVVSKQVVIAAAAVNARTVLGLAGDCLITSGNDSQHMAGSKHFTDEALDFRTHGLTSAEVAEWAKAVKRRLGTGYDVVVESDHLHVELDTDA